MSEPTSVEPSPEANETSAAPPADLDVAGAGSTPVVCPTCQHATPFDGDARQSVILCSECGTRIAFGVAQPRVVIEPSGPFVTLRFSGVAIRDKAGNRVELADIQLDRQYAKTLGLNVLSIT